MSQTETVGEIIYLNEDNHLVHSDIGVSDASGLADAKYRKFLHRCLDEWLDESKGTGVFYIGNRFHPYAG